MKKTNIFRTLLVAVIMMAAAGSAQAQFGGLGSKLKAKAKDAVKKEAKSAVKEQAKEVTNEAQGLQDDEEMRGGVICLNFHKVPAPYGWGEKLDVNKDSKLEDKYHAMAYYLYQWKKAIAAKDISFFESPNYDKGRQILITNNY